MTLTGDKLRLLRLARGMKQRELAGKMGIRQQRISVLENSPGISAEQTKKIFAVLKLSKPEAEKIFKEPTIYKKRRKGKRRGYACLLS